MTTMTIIIYCALVLVIVVILLVAMKFIRIKHQDWIPEEEIGAFVGANSDFYLTKWKERQGRFHKGWNWSAAFFGVEWLFYRKLYFKGMVMFFGFWYLSRYSRSVPVSVLLWLPFCLACPPCQHV